VTEILVLVDQSLMAIDLISAAVTLKPFGSSWSNRNSNAYVGEGPSAGQQRRGLERGRSSSLARFSFSFLEERWR